MATAAGPPDSDFAVTLSRHCPTQPSEAESTNEPHVAFTQAGRFPVQLLANPAVGQTGPSRVCVWLVRDDQSVSARYSHSVTVPKSSLAPDLTSVLINSHPSSWVPLGSLGFLLLLGVIAACVLIPIGLIVLFSRRHRARIARIREEGREDARLDDIREQADSDSPDLPADEQPTQETPPVGCSTHVHGDDVAGDDGELAESFADGACDVDGGDGVSAEAPTDPAHHDAGTSADRQVTTSTVTPPPDADGDPAPEPPRTDELD
jgi:hypothetical protein